ncbi:MAG: Trk family potassium uptake protein [Clostridia bacterium]|nr:Trk family potassium uptake protein [Clostridia bacterium]
MKKINLLNTSGKGLAPANLIVISFLSAILIGTILLVMPFSSKLGHSIGFINALFTATSAVCVTGLVVADTATTFSIFGQTVIIILIQLGGLGIMTAAALFSMILGRRMGLKERLTLQESISEFNLQGIVKLFKNILIATFSIELAGAFILSFSFIPIYGFVRGVAKSIFHSISAFCNAGFDIMGTAEQPFQSLTNLNNHAGIVIPIALLFILGGMGFVVWRDIVRVRKFKEFMLHTKVVLIFSGILILTGTILFLLFEFNNTMEGMGFFQKLMNAFFHSVTPRTAGFNTLDVASMTSQSQLITIILMFIGAAPGSTAGGIKVTTFAIILFTVITYVRGINDVNMMKRKVSENIVKKSLSIVFMAFSLILLTTIVLLISEAGTLAECLFEAVSAFGTVGLSTGITPSLPFAGKIAIIITMFFGRVGPLAVALSLTQSKANKQLFTYPEGKISVG